MVSNIRPGNVAGGRQRSGGDDAPAQVGLELEVRGGFEGQLYRVWRLLPKVAIYTMTSRQLDVGPHVWGDAYLFEHDQPFTTENEARAVLDRAAAAVQLQPPGADWFATSFAAATELLRNGLTYDLAYSRCTISDPATVARVHAALLAPVPTADVRYCFTNCSPLPWTPMAAKGYSWNPLTEQTIDIGVGVLWERGVWLGWFMGED